MSKSVLMAIQPYYVFLIIARLMGWDIPQEKTVEVRKDFPKDSAWNKTVHIYCGKNRKSFNRIPAQYQPLMKKFLAKVIGEFVCDRIEKQAVFHKGITRIMIQGYKEKLFALCKAAALSLDELHAYIDKAGKDFEIVSGWHIDDLKIYDEPKELGEFKAWRWECETVESQFYHCRFGYAHEAHCRFCKWIRYAPQSWRYIEELKA